ncbi:MAG TPA: hypothetical protein VMR14_12355 [Streptosporangiaceae bacterium]|jgi:hypothetical protein|nr:hypothetical protein [Streptosporangiaceae bacterium]
MTRPRITAPGLAARAAGLLAIGFLIAGCGPGSSSSSSGGPSSTPRVGSSSSPSSGKSTAASGSGGTATSLFPATVGDTWVDRDTLGDHETGKSTNTITAVTPDSDGKKVTIAIRTENPGTGPTSTTVSYQLYNNGSIGVPFSQFDNSTVTVKGGGIVWPPAAELATGQPHTSTLSVVVNSSATKLAVKALVTVKGEGTQSVTVPAGTYSATVISETISEKIEGIDAVTQVTTWVANGLGPVKSVVATKTGSVSVTDATDVLVSFKQG